MKKLKLEIYLENDWHPNIDPNKKEMEIVIGGEVWGFSLDSVRVDSKPTFSGIGGYYSRCTGVETEYFIEGVAFNKTKRELEQAKADVRKKQEEFKEAQRKLNKLMGN